MLRTVYAIAFVFLAVVAILQYRTISRLSIEADFYKQRVRRLELAKAGSQGALAGLVLTFRDKHEHLVSSLIENASRISELQGLVEQKEHLLASMQQGHVLTVTAYSPTVCQTNDSPFITANNQQVRQGIVAVSRDLFQRGWVFGRQVYIKGHGVFLIDDLLSNNKRNQLDIFMFNQQRALNFGKRKLRVYLLGA